VGHIITILIISYDWLNYCLIVPKNSPTFHGSPKVTWKLKVFFRLQLFQLPLWWNPDLPDVHVKTCPQLHVSIVFYFKIWLILSKNYGKKHSIHSKFSLKLSDQQPRHTSDTRLLGLAQDLASPRELRRGVRMSGIWQKQNMDWNHPNLINTCLFCSGWWYTYPSEKILASWDYYSQYMGKKHVPNHQPVVVLNLTSFSTSITIYHVFWRHIFRYRITAPWKNTFSFLPCEPLKNIPFQTAFLHPFRRRPEQLHRGVGSESIPRLAHHGAGIFTYNVRPPR